MFKRRRLKKKLTTLEDGLSAWAKTAQEQATKLPPGPGREALIKKARQAQVASHIDDWAKSPGLQPPK